MLIAESLDLRAVHGRMVALIDLVGGEIRHVHGGIETGLERGADGAELVPADAVEERVVTDVGATVLAGRGAEAVVGIAEEAAGFQRG